MKRYLPIILILLAIGIFFVFIDPEYTKVKELSRERVENEKTLTLAKQLQDKREVLQSSFNNISAAEKDQLSKLLPDTVDNVRLVLDINNIAETYGVVIRNISVEAEQANNDLVDAQVISADNTDNIGVITLGFSMVATYDVFIQFMKDLEEALRIVDIKSLSVQKSSLEGNFLNFTITLDTYWLR